MSVYLHITVRKVHLEQVDHASSVSFTVRPSSWEKPCNSSDMRDDTTAPSGSVRAHGSRYHKQ